LLILTACHVASDSQLDYQDPATLPSQTIEDTEEPSTQPDIIEETTSPSMPTNATRPEPSTRPTEPPKVYPNYYGRLHIPKVSINVALYYGADQSITNRKDSANIFSMSVFDGLYIADHKT
jgi:sortase (surface protein transpeptidase)